MKVLIFIENNRGGGVDTFIVDLINYWPNKDHKFTIICNDGHPGISYIDEQLNNKCKIVKHKIPLNWSFLSFIIKYLPNIVQRVLRQSFRIMLSPIQYYWLKSILQRERGDQLISVNGGYPGGETCRLANIAWKSLTKKDSIHNIHNFALKPRYIFSCYENYIDKKLIKSCKKIISVSNYCSNTILARKSFKNSNKIMTIYNGLEIKNNLNSNRTSLRDILNIGIDDKLIIMLGTYEKRKGHEYLLKAMSYVYKRFPNIHLAMLGTGTKNEELFIKSCIKKYTPAKNIHMPGFIQNANEMIKEADILAVPDQDFASFGLTIVEAMLNKVPVVSTDIGGLPETIGENGKCGFYCNSSNPKVFSEKIIYIIDNKDKCIEIIKNGELRAKEFFNPERMAKQYHDVL
jgi:glycosyltransferase involved in cell wall biosynthesis